MEFLTLGKASKLIGKTKGAVSKAIKSGRLSATRNDKGYYQIDPAELHRVYPYRVEETPEKCTAVNPRETHEINNLKEILKVKNDRIKDLEEDRILIRGLLTDERSKNVDTENILNQEVEALRIRVEQAETDKNKALQTARHWKNEASKSWYKKLFG